MARAKLTEIELHTWYNHQSKVVRAFADTPNATVSAVATTNMVEKHLYIKKKPEILSNKHTL